jgi:hypothetical protein
MSVLSVPHQKKKLLLHIGGVRIVGGNSHWTLWLTLTIRFTETWLVYQQKSTIYIYICTHTSPLIPQVASVCLTLHGQCCIRYENVFTTWGRDHKTFLGPHALGARSWPVARQTRNLYLTIGTVLKQASSWGNKSEIHITRQKNTYLLTLS